MGLNFFFNGALRYARLILKKFHLAFETFQVTRFARIRFLAVMLLVDNLKLCMMANVAVKTNNKIQRKKCPHCT